MKKPFRQEQPFPWRCHACRKDTVFRTKTVYEAQARHDDKVHSFTIPALETPTCQACGSRLFDDNADNQIIAALRRHLDLLSPEDIQKKLADVGMSAHTVAAQLGIPASELEQLLNEQSVQSRATDNLLRLFFEFAVVRDYLGGRNHE